MAQAELKIVKVNTGPQVQEIIFRSEDGKAHGVVYYDEPSIHVQIPDGAALPLTLGSTTAAAPPAPVDRTKPKETP